MGLMKPLLYIWLKGDSEAIQATYSVTSKDPAHFCLLAFKKAISC
jgi:hypothetical protein